MTASDSQIVPPGGVKIVSGYGIHWDFAELKVSFEGVKTRLTMALGVAVFLIGSVVPVLIKTFTSPPIAAITPVAATANPELRDLERQVERLDRQIEKMSDQQKPLPVH